MLYAIYLKKDATEISRKKNKFKDSNQRSISRRKKIYHT